MESQENLKKPTERWIQVIITQCICVAIILATVLVTKYLFSDNYAQLKDWYTQNICADTDINEVLLSEGETDEI